VRRLRDRPFVDLRLLFIPWAFLRTTIQSWQPNGDTPAYRYYYTAQTTNEGNGTDAGTIQTGPASVKCYFFYNPNGPSAPTVTVNGGPFPTSVHLGDIISSVTFAPTLKSGQTCPGASVCPASYT
jgi:hypothetical protein